MRLFLLAFLFFIAIGISAYGKQPRVLVFTKTTGFRHSSIPAGVAAIMKLGKAEGFDVDTTSDASMFNRKTLHHYKAILFLNTTGDVLDSAQQEAFQHYIRSGGGFVGIHAAADCEFQWEWYGQLVGGYFQSHPVQQEATIRIAGSTDASTRHLPSPWVRKDEWYNYKNLSPDIQVLLLLDETSYTGGTNGAYHPISWKHEFDGGRAWYTGLGHTDASYSEPAFLEHLQYGIMWAMRR